MNSVSVVRARAIFYKAVVQGFLLCWSEIWDVTDVMMKVVEGFHHLIAERIAGNTAWKFGEEVWKWPPVEEALEAAVMWPMQECVWRRQATIQEYLSPQSVNELCTGAERLQRTSQKMW